MLSAYDLSLGCVQIRERGPVRVSLWREHGVYQIRAHEFDGRGRLAWTTARSLREANRTFASMVSLYL